VPAIERRLFLGGLGASALTAGCRSEVRDGPYPSRDITCVIPTGAGGGADIYARLIGAAMEDYLPDGVNVIPKNIPSGGGGKGILELYRARPDGYTIGMLNIPGIFVLQRTRHMPFDFRKFTWLGGLTDGENYGMAVGWNSPVRDIGDLRRIAARRELTFATTGPEGFGYTATQISTRILGLRNRLISGYRGSSDYVVAAIRGDSDAVVAAITTLQRMQEGRQVRIVASFAEEGGMPGVPDATGLGFPELALLKGERVVAGPPGMPPAIVDKLAEALTHAWRSPQLLRWAEGLGEKIAPKSPDQTAAMVDLRLAFLNRWLATNQA
jgi:tripartite-type tricarboxylate transporter receptor subunit TctC